LGERHHGELITLLCLLVVMYPSISFSSISTTTARWISPHSLQTKALQLQLHLFNQQNNHSLPNSTAEW
jgi:hypothetical protein